jgi:uncharacterized protein YggE
MNMNMKHSLIVAALLCASISAFAAPASAQEPDRRSERSERTSKADRDRARDTVYSNRTVRREREAARIIRDAERKSRPAHYQFRDRKPD